MSIQTVTREIIQGNFTNDELSGIIEAVKFAKSRLQKSTIRNLRIGDPVTFTSSKTGQTVKGIVQKIAVKYVTVNTNIGLWRVPANMLSVTEQELA